MDTNLNPLLAKIDQLSAAELLIIQERITAQLQQKIATSGPASAGAGNIDSEAYYASLDTGQAELKGTSGGEGQAKEVARNDSALLPKSARSYYYIDYGYHRK